MHLTPVEVFRLIWTSSSLIGLFGFQIFGLIDAYLDREALRNDNQNGGRLLTANKHIRDETVACTIHSAFAIAGILSLVNREPEVAHAPVTIVSILVTIAICYVNFIVVINAYFGRRDRKRLDQYVDREGVSDVHGTG